MVAKITNGNSIYGALIYNQKKVDAQKAHVIYANRIISNLNENPKEVLHQYLKSFEYYLINNKRTEKPVVHISLNPAIEDNLSEKQLAALARDYMERMGFKDQPYIVYKHEDIDRHHLHIVTVRVDEMGKKINDSYEKLRSMDACRELELKYGLKMVSSSKQEELVYNFQKVDVTKDKLQKQVSSTLKYVLENYKFQSFGEYNAVCPVLILRQNMFGEKISAVVFTMVSYMLLLIIRGILCLILSNLRSSGSWQDMRH